MIKKINKSHTTKLNIIQNHIEEHLKVVNIIDIKLKKKILKTAEILSYSLKKGGTIFWCGNGGSASDSMHLAAELIGKFKKKREPLKSISLASNPSVITCISNDFGYENLFSRQIQALGKKNDVLVTLSTSGNSKNIIKAIKQAKNKKLNIINFLGNDGGKCKNTGDLDLIINSTSTARIQEIHIMIGQIICDLIEKNLKL